MNEWTEGSAYKLIGNRTNIGVHCKLWILLKMLLSSQLWPLTLPSQCPVWSECWFNTQQQVQWSCPRGNVHSSLYRRFPIPETYGIQMLVDVAKERARQSIFTLPEGIPWERKEGEVKSQAHCVLADGPLQLPALSSVVDCALLEEPAHCATISMLPHLPADSHYSAKYLVICWLRIVICVPSLWAWQYRAAENSHSCLSLLRPEEKW